MSLGTFMNFAALAVAIAALGVSVVFARRQLSSAAAASTVQVAIEVLTRETRTDAFLESEEFVLHQMTAKFPPEQGVSQLPLEARRHFRRVAMYYADLGVLAVFGESQRTVIVAAMHGPALRTWHTLRPYIDAERAARGATPYLNFFEHLACICTETDLAALHKDLGLRSFGASVGVSGAGPSLVSRSALPEESNSAP